MPLHSAIIFQSTHPLRGATRQKAVSRFHDGISIHAPLAGCDTPSKPTQKRLQISIHAPLAGCDHEQHGRTQTCAQNFNPRTPCGVRRVVMNCAAASTTFQSTHPLRGATLSCLYPPITKADFNPRTPCGVRHHSGLSRSGRRHFNPRTPCGVRPSCRPFPAREIRFQSTHPLRGATAKAHKKMRHFCANSTNTSTLCAKNAHPAT